MGATEVVPLSARTPGVTGAIGVIYCLFGLGFLLAIAMGGTILGIPLEWSAAWPAALFVVVGIGVLRRTVWGRWLGYLLSAPFLLGIPIGTLLGGFMIWHLTRYRAMFTRWY